MRLSTVTLLPVALAAHVYVTKYVTVKTVFHTVTLGWDEYTKAFPQKTITTSHKESDHLTTSVVAVVSSVETCGPASSDALVSSLAAPSDLDILETPTVSPQVSTVVVTTSQGTTTQQTTTQTSSQKESVATEETTIAEEATTASLEQQSPVVSSSAPETSSTAPTTTTAQTSTDVTLSTSAASSSSALFSGQGTWYETGLGACGITNTDTDYIVAISQLYFDLYTPAGNPNDNTLCGRQIKATYQGKSVVVTAVDRCEACAYYDLDFSPSAFSQLADQLVGRIDIEWEWIS